eukprot:11157962-Alexandrium_andersonii.AAC.1
MILLSAAWYPGKLSSNSFSCFATGCASVVCGGCTRGCGNGHGLGLGCGSTMGMGVGSGWRGHGCGNNA